MIILSPVNYQISNPFTYKIRIWEPPANYRAQTDIEKIKNDFSKNKVVPKHLKNLFYETIVHYPELKNTYLFIVEEKFYGIQHTLRSYPPMLSLLNTRESRACPIVINTNKHAQISFYALSKEQQKGILAHELSHIVDYSKRSSFELIILSFMFCVSKSFVKKLEQTTDEMTVQRGCGADLLEFKKYVAEKATASYGFYKDVIYGDGMVRGWRAFIFSVKYSINTAVCFLIVLQQMMMLVYVKKIHKRG